ncbi:fibronectin type III domain-containing protein [Candidatus Parcubacteria bacterium]|nr:fibronectin type III domain-containing protein [Candidatus Parcubacteria bacterium]
MNKTFKTILITSIAVFSAGLLVSPACATTGILEINFQKDPLFGETNFMPGDTITKWVEVINNTGGTKSIATEAINWPNFPDYGAIPNNDLSRALLIAISEQGGSDLYGGTTGEKTLFQFYQNGETYLSDVANSTTTYYDFQISFPSEKGNDWQSKTTGFDIIVGSQGEYTPTYACNDGIDNDGDGEIDYPDDPGCDSPTDDDEVDSAPPTPPGGGGGGGLPPGLTIRYEDTTCIGPCDAIIHWLTSYNATSRVVYGTESGTFDLNHPNYGYPSTTLETDNIPPINENGTTSHTVILTGLATSTTYYFRCVSHASPATVGFEHSFTTLALGEGDPCCGELPTPPAPPTPPTPPIPPSPPIAEAPPIIEGTPALPGEAPAELTDEEKIEEIEEKIKELEAAITQVEEESESNLDKFLAAIGGLFDIENSCLILTILAIILTVLFILSRKKKREEEKKYMDLIVVLLVLIILALLFKCLYLIIPILLLIGVLIYEILKKKKKKKGEFIVEENRF